MQKSMTVGFFKPVSSVKIPFSIEEYLQYWKERRVEHHSLYYLEADVKCAFYNWEIDKIKSRYEYLSRENIVLEEEKVKELKEVNHMVFLGALNNFYAVDLMRISLVKLGVAEEIPELKGNLNLSSMLDILGITRKQRIELWEILCKDDKDINYDSLKKLFGEKDGKLNLEGLDEIDKNNIEKAMPREMQNRFWCFFSEEKKHVIEGFMETNGSNLCNGYSYYKQKNDPVQDVD